MVKVLRVLGVFWYYLLIKSPIYIMKVTYYIILLLPLLAVLWKMPYRFIGWLWTAKRNIPKWN